MIEVRELASKKERRIFASFNAEMYKDVEQAIPDIVSDEYNNFNPRKNPAYEYCRVKQFLAYKDGKCVGRIAAIINDAANSKWETKRIRFSRVDFIDDYEVSKALFKAVEDWARAEGLTQIHGPIGFCDLDQEGMLVEGFDIEGMFITIYNYPYYIKHMEKLGFIKDIDWVEYLIKMPEEPNKKLNDLSKLVLKRYKLDLIEPKSRREIKPYLPKIFELLNIAYKDLYGTVELSQAQIMKYYHQFILLVNVEYVKLVMDEEGELVGFALAVPSMNRPVKKSNGRLFPFGWYRILRAPFAKTEVLDLYLIGVVQRMQNKGLTAILMHSMTESARKNKVKYAETGPELETNVQVQALWKHYETKQHKRRRCWIKDI
ncbi:MAG: hypothetical protein GX319_08190 [Clostridiales bacterium]|jgi:GNAT superfamily N-acetyltransferase|nr:hypothetical protein [Bacillota bacterium]NLK04372.1 hypothetical protein [Clostridiales bacterium]